MKRALLAVLVFAPCVATAGDGDWAKALYAELEQGELEQAAELYRGMDEERAGLRLLTVLAKQRKAEALVEEAKRQRERFPSSRAIARVAKDPAAFLRETARKRGTERKRTIREKTVTLNFEETPLREALDMFAMITGIGVVLLPEVDPDLAVSAKVKDLSARSALRLLLAPSQLDYEVTCGAIVVGKGPARVIPPKVSRRAARKNPEGYLALRTLRVTLSFEGTPLQDSLEFLEDISGVACALSGVDPATPISIQVRDVTLGEAVSLVAAQAGASVTLTPEGLRLGVE